MNLIKKLLLVVVIYVLSGLYNNTICYEKPIAVVTKLKGSCVVVRKTNKVKLQQAAPIYADDRILTFSASYVEIMFDSGVALRIEENSEFDVKIFLSTYGVKGGSYNIKIKLISGAVLVDTGSLQSKCKLNSFVVVTPSVVVSVRGTVFYVRISDDQTTSIAVFDGELDCFIGTMEDEDIDKFFFTEEETKSYAMKKMVINKDKQIIVSPDLSSFVVTELAYDIMEYKRTTVENFVKASKKIRENLDRWYKKREQFIKEQKSEFKESIDKQRDEFMKEFGIDKKQYKKERK